VKKIEMETGARTEVEQGPTALSYNPNLDIGMAAYGEIFMLILGGCTRGMQCDVEFEYQLRVSSIGPVGPNLVLVSKHYYT
jgi:hypothetical protein